MFSRRGGNRGWGRAGALVIGLGLPWVCQASLGGDVRTVLADAEQLNATAQVTSATGYQVHEITTSSGQVREYVAHGVVFAVAWSGRSMPNLDALLGVHAQEFRAAVAPQPGNHHRVSLESDHLKVYLRQLPRGFEGRVVAAALVPEGVDLTLVR